MASEETPLLTTRGAAAHKNIYDRFTPNQKRWIVFVVSLAGVLPMFVRAVFVPSIPQIAKDLSSTDAGVSLGVSLSIFATSVGALVWAAYSSVYGRRLMYLCGMPILFVGSCGVAASTSLESLLIWRFVQNFGCAGCMSLGAGVISDIYMLEERGFGMGIFSGSALVGLAIAPFLGGVASQYWSWRHLHYTVGAWALLQLLVMYLSLPETSHPGAISIGKVTPRRRFYIPWVNPLRSLLLLRSPNLIASMFAASLVFMSDYVLLVPLAYTIGVRYGITNEAVIGACFLPSGLGNFIGAPIAGRLSDIAVRKGRARRNGAWYPEDRLRSTWIGGLFMVPISLAASGLITRYVDGTVGLTLNLLCFFTNGMGAFFVLNPVGAYNVDVVRSQSAEITAANTAVRSFILSIATSLVIPSIEHIGVAWTDIIGAFLALIGQGIIFYMIRYGDRMRPSTSVVVGF